MNSIFQRASVRRFLDKPVEAEKLELLMRAAMAAPSAGNQQPWEFYVVTRRKTLSALAGCSPYAGSLSSAPAGIIVCGRTAASKYPSLIDTDLAAATENILLEAVELGLGAVWLGVAGIEGRADAVAAVLETPSTLRPFAMIACGYPEEPQEPQDRYDPARVHML